MLDLVKWLDKFLGRLKCAKYSTKKTTCYQSHVNNNKKVSKIACTYALVCPQLCRSIKLSQQEVDFCLKNHSSQTILFLGFNLFTYGTLKIMNL